MVSSVAAAVSSAAMSRSILSILESVLSKCTSLAVAASTAATSVAATSVAVALSIASAFEAEACGGVPSITSVTVIILRFLAQLPSSLSRAPFPSEKASSDVAQWT
jgi:D-aminopeptidase